MRTGPALLACIVVASCMPFGGPDVFTPRSDYGFPPEPSSYSQPGDCEGGSRLAARELAEPEYPPSAWARGQQGWVVLSLDVDPEGRTRQVRVIDAQPEGPFDRAARATVRSWRFEPPGEPGLERCVVVLDYRLGVGRIGL